MSSESRTKSVHATDIPTRSESDTPPKTKLDRVSGKEIDGTCASHTQAEQPAATFDNLEVPQPATSGRAPRESSPDPTGDPAQAFHTDARPQDENHGVDMSASTDEDALRVLHDMHPAVAKEFRVIAEDIVRKALNDAHQTCHQECQRRIAELEAEVAEFRVAREALETSNTYNWQVTDDRLTALEARTSVSNLGRAHRQPAPPRCPRNLVSGYLNFYYEGSKISLRMPNIREHRTRLLFLASTEGKKGKFGYMCEELGRPTTEDEPDVIAAPNDKVLIRSPGTYKLLLKLYYLICERKAELVRQWKLENSEFVNLLGPTKPHETEPSMSPQFHELRLENTPARIDVIPFEKVRNGYVRVNSQGQSRQSFPRRFLVERAPPNGPISALDAAASTSIYHEVATGLDVQREPEDVVVEESEEMFRKLAVMYSDLEEQDLMETRRAVGVKRPSKHKLKENEEPESPEIQSKRSGK